MRLVIVARPIVPAERATERDEWGGEPEAGDTWEAGDDSPEGTDIVARPLWPKKKGPAVARRPQEEDGM